MAGNAFHIPHFLSAEDPDGLRQLMLKQNLMDSAEYKYFEISKVGKLWYAWFYKEVDQRALVARELAKELVNAD